MLTNIHAQSSDDPLSGQYSTYYNGDHLSLVIQAPSGNSYAGTMRDSYQTYEISLTRNGTAITGTATETSLGLTFQISGSLTPDLLNLKFEIEVQGTKTGMEIAFTKQDASKGPMGSSTTNAQMPLAFPSGAEHPAALIGTWTKEEFYQSGSGDNYMGAGFSQSMTLLSNGQMTEGGSNTYISGSNYSGQSSGESQQVVPGALWYAQGNQLYLILTEKGNTQTYHLGRFYIENNKLLLTATNGEKILMHKS